MRQPGESTPGSMRGVFALLLCLILPPLGLLFLWRKGVFRSRGRWLITLLATIEMGVIIGLWMPKTELPTVSPVPAAAVRVTHAPESEVANALSNIDDILYQQQLDEVLANGGSEDDLLSYEELLAKESAQMEEILNTVVYAYYGDGAQYYHAAPMCGDQSNRRELTVAEAISEYLAACPNCNPPVYGFSSTTN